VKTLRLLLVVLIVSGCYKISSPEYKYFQPGSFYSYVSEVDGNVEIKHIVGCSVFKDRAEFSYMWKTKEFLGKDSVAIYFNDSLKVYVFDNYKYNHFGPVEKRLEFSDFQDTLRRVHMKSDSIIIYNSWPCEKRIFDEMYERYEDY
jgi:hypothetical protein